MEQEQKPSFHELFDRYLNQANKTLSWMRRQDTAPSEASLERWYKGETVPRAWVDVLRIAALLKLRPEETNFLLEAAQHPDIETIIQGMPHASRDEQAIITTYTESLSDQHDKDLLRMLQHMARIPSDGLPPPRPYAGQDFIPFHHSDLFVGRDVALLRMATSLKERKLGAIGQGLILSGLAGLGKTTLVTAFCHYYGQYFEGGVFWVSCGDPAAIAEAVARSGQHLDPEFATWTLERQVAAVKAAWQDSRPCLVIFDTCEDEELLITWKPHSRSCWTVVTSRRSAWGARADVIVEALTVLERNDSIALLRKYRPGIAKKFANAIANDLGDVPLALHLAGSFLENNQYDLRGGDPEVFLSRLRDTMFLDRSAEAALQDNADIQRIVSPVARTFIHSYRSFDLTDPCDKWALHLLGAAAYFAPGEPIPLDVLISAVRASEDEASLYSLINHGIKRLLDVGFVIRGQDYAIIIHRLIAQQAQRLAEDSAILHRVEASILESVVKVNDGGRPLHMQPLLPHLYHTATRAQHRLDDRAASLVDELAYHLYLQGAYKEAAAFYERVSTIKRTMEGASPTDIAISLDNLANALRQLGRYTEARNLMEEALAIYELSGGLDSVAGATWMNNYGYLLDQLKEYDLALSYYQRALKKRQEIYGVGHVETATILANLANTFQLQEKFAEAQPVLEEALTIYRTELGSDHPLTANAINDLGLLYGKLARHDQALELLDQALAIYEREYGDEHYYVAVTLHNLADVRVALAQPSAALKLYTRALRICKKHFEPDHIAIRKIQAKITALKEAGRSESSE